MLENHVMYVIKSLQEKNKNEVIGIFVIHSGSNSIVFSVNRFDGNRYFSSIYKLAISLKGMYDPHMLMNVYKLLD